MLDLLNQILVRIQLQEPVAVCVLVGTRGSTPQKPGAMMVVLSSGQTLGTIGGGCVEAEVRTRALQQLGAGGSQLLSFNLNHDHGWDDGLVCGGQMQVAMLVLSTGDNAAAFVAARDNLTDGRPADLKITVRDEKNEPATFTLPIMPSPRLIIAGAGHVGAVLAAIAHLMDFSVTVVDDRPEYASLSRFPHATCRIGQVDSELSKLRIDRETYIVIVTRGHRRDALALASVVRSSAVYIGLIGSKRKIVTIFEQLLLQQVTAEQLARVHAPIGLDIGAVTPAEIAVSIAAEMTAVRRKQACDSIQPMRLTDEQLRRIGASTG